MAKQKKDPPKYHPKRYRKNPKPTQLTKPRRLTKAEKIARTPIENLIGDWSTEVGQKKARDAYQTLLNGYNRRIAQFKRKGLVSHAQMIYESSMPKNYQLPDPKTASFNKLVLEVARLQNFFKSDTSFVAGIKALDREQDIRIFGAGKFGRPKRTMTFDERTRFWELYDEFYNQNKTAYSKYSSESIQQVLASALFTKDGFSGFVGDPDFNIMELLDSVKDRLDREQEEENIQDVPAVYRGWGPFRR